MGKIRTKVAKDPAFLFYPSDWYYGTAAFTRHQKGAYMDLLMCQFNLGPMTLTDIKVILGTDFDMWEAKLKSKFKVDTEGKFYNVRLEEEKIKRIKFTRSRSDNLHMVSHVDEHMLKHMENKDKDENNQQNKKQFIPPELIDVINFCNDNNLAVYAEKFIDYYTSKGWKVGSEPMKNWQAACRNWARSDFNKPIGDTSDIPLEFRTKK